MRSESPRPAIRWREPGQAVSPEYRRDGALRYSAEAREIVGRNLSCFNNRPLYCPPETDSVVLTGDRPLVRLIADRYVLGAFSASIVRGGSGKWFHEYQQVESRYRCGRMTWRVSDPALPQVEATLDVVPMSNTGGFILRLRADGLRTGDRLLWAFGGARAEERGNARSGWDPVYQGNPHVCKTGGPKSELKAGPVAEWCRGNVILIEDQTFQLRPSPEATQIAFGRSSRSGELRVAEASAWSDPNGLIRSTAAELPIVSGRIDLEARTDEVIWAVASVPAPAKANAPQISASAEAFETASAYLTAVERVQTCTPEPRLDAAVAAVCHPIDAACERNPFIFRHGCMMFSIRFLGWRVIYGATALGWHDRVSGNVAHYVNLQVKTDSERTRPEPDPRVRGCHEGPQSRFWGRGRLAPDDKHMYNTQTQFFDQAVRDWRWTADPELEKILRPGLELHLEWARDCFDPDDDGLYESYINTLPTDSVWYNGGGSVEESAYAYCSHLAAMDMARRAGDATGAERHRSRAEKIRRALRDVLWCEDRGHFGLYREQGGHCRVHPDAWVYSEFLPIDAGMTTPEEAIQALYYTEWGLERIHLPFGGVLCQPSNWVPSKWSVRDMFGGDMFHHALAYFQTGLSDDGWELLLGATLESAYAGAVPGGFSHVGAGTDFADNCHMFARAVVEGLFGYDPDYPNGIVRIRPAFPACWPKASIRTPDYTLDFGRDGDADTYRLTLANPADADFRLPVRAKNIRRVVLNGQSVPWEVEAGFGCTQVRIHGPRGVVFDLRIELTERVPPAPAVTLEGNTGDEICLSVQTGLIESRHDFHAVIEDAQTKGTTIRGHLARKPGHHMVLVDVSIGELPQRRVFKIHVVDPEEQARRLSRTPREASKRERWRCLDLASHCNGDVRTIFQQQYLSPRPLTCSVRLGVDGYSAWTFPYWGEQPPTIDLSNLPKLDDGRERVVTPQNVPFARFADGKNIAFTSLWDNWPHSVTVPVHSEAEAAWLLVCGSTFPMQTRIANAELRFQYADGVVEKMELIPPLNFWSLCPWGGLDYDDKVDGFCLPEVPPAVVQLGNNCRAMVLSWKLRPGIRLRDVTLETLSQDVVIGLMGISLMNPPACSVS